MVVKNEICRECAEKEAAKGAVIATERKNIAAELHKSARQSLLVWRTVKCSVCGKVESLLRV